LNELPSGVSEIKLTDYCANAYQQVFKKNISL